MGTCYAISPQLSFNMSCSSTSALVKVSCTGYSNGNCAGEPSKLPCPYTFDLPATCMSGYRASCEGNPDWLSWPGYALYSNVSASTDCSVTQPASIFGFSPNCSTYDLNPLFKYSQQAVVEDDNLVVKTYMSQECTGSSTSVTVV